MGLVFDLLGGSTMRHIPAILFALLLGEFAYADLNLTKIQSRPTKRQLGDYMFFVDFEGHVEDSNVRTALDCLRLKLREVKVLGSYARV